MTTVRITAAVLQATADEWDGWGEACGDARRDLLRATSSGFGPPGAALDAFVDTWAARAGTLRDRAQRHADDLRVTAADFDAEDAAAAADLLRLLPAEGAR
ncbi:hypothetical protein GCM10009737_10200 [Nocardioides lentus]|uniref:Uncharacterized protein n=1 Tax=Nocardioides lentus TaxID=338077 RepID=A0ABP5AE74_9ACTN